jgi:hypothetical protein
VEGKTGPANPRIAERTAEEGRRKTRSLAEAGEAKIVKKGIARASAG